MSPSYSEPTPPGVQRSRAPRAKPGHPPDAARPAEESRSGRDVGGTPLAAVLAVLAVAGVAAALLDHTLVVRGAGATLTRLLAGDPEREVVWDGIRRLAARVRTEVATGHGSGDGGASTCDLRTGQGGYRLTLGMLPSPDGAAPWASGHVLVVVEHRAPPRTREAALRARFGLSPREAEVACRAALGESTPTIAAALGLSPHTVRHHLERIYARLGVHSRAALAARVATLELAEP